ncbi:unnamed protein product [Moneuplotes crassus]|uniref:PNPLA domain-containing protein n=1 Tax=Euplotes crassus TaxID=5936 RepID=A0AAD2CZ01_EUPCR|nr:unnamed protein product [Moneuplotes crassus]
MKLVGIIVMILLVSAMAKNKCRILSLSSGTEKAAYQVGALKALIEHLDPKEVEYDVISGVSFGAFNAAMMAVHEKGDEKEALEELYGIWKNAKSIKTYQNWWFGPAQGVVNQGGLYDSKPWKQFLEKTIDGRNAKRMMTLGAVNVESGKYTDLVNIITPDTLHSAISAATALNIFFPPANEFGADWFDGSGVWPVEVIGPIRRCEQLGFSRADIIVDVLMTNSYDLPVRNATNDSTIPSALRYFEIADFYSGVNGIARAISSFSEVTFRHCVNPGKNHLPTNWFPFDFNQKKIDVLLERGYEDALKTINNPDTVTCQNLVKSVAHMKPPTPPKEVDDLIKGEFE